MSSLEINGLALDESSMAGTTKSKQSDQTTTNSVTWPERFWKSSGRDPGKDGAGPFSSDLFLLAARASCFKAPQRRMGCTGGKGGPLTFQLVSASISITDPCQEVG